VAESQSGASAGTGAQGPSFPAMKCSGPCIHTLVQYNILLLFLCLWNSIHFTAMQAATKLCSYNNPAASHYDSNPKSKSSKLHQPLPDFPSPFLG